MRLEKTIDGPPAILNDALTCKVGAFIHLMKNLLGILAILLTTSTALSVEYKVTGTFSSLRLGTEDLTGMEVSVVIGDDDHYFIVQCAEGTPGVPEVTVAHLQGTALSFQLSRNTCSGCPATEFRGSINDDGLTGAFNQSNWPGFLKRGPSYWQ